MQRLTPSLIRKYNPALATAAITLVLTDERKLKFKAVLNCNAPNLTGGGESMQAVEVADAAGKVRVWPDVDTLLRSLSKELYNATAITFAADTTKLVPSYSPTATPAQIAQKQHGAIVVGLPAQIKRVNDAVVKLNAVASFQSGTPAQQGVWAEKKAAVDTATAQQVWMIAERDRLATLFTPTLP